MDANKLSQLWNIYNCLNKNWIVLNLYYIAVAPLHMFLKANIYIHLSSCSIYIRLIVSVTYCTARKLLWFFSPRCIPASHSCRDLFQLSNSSSQCSLPLFDNCFFFYFVMLIGSIIFLLIFVHTLFFDLLFFCNEHHAQKSLGSPSSVFDDNEKAVQAHPSAVENY